jgi:hypothetical protein
MLLAEIIINSNRWYVITCNKVLFPGSAKLQIKADILWVTSNMLTLVFSVIIDWFWLFISIKYVIIYSRGRFGDIPISKGFEFKFLSIKALQYADDEFVLKDNVW